MYFNQQGYGNAPALETMKQDDYLFLLAVPFLYLCQSLQRLSGIFVGMQTCIILERVGET